MSRRITVVDVRTAYEALVKAAQRHQVNTDKWQLHEGSSTYGRAYRIYDDGRGALGLSQGFIGLTAQQAYDTIHAILSVLWALGDVHHRGMIDGWREAAAAFIGTGHVDPEWPGQ